MIIFEAVRALELPLLACEPLVVALALVVAQLVAIAFSLQDA